jgi:hypothetical protein
MDTSKQDNRYAGRFWGMYECFCKDPRKDKRQREILRDRINLARKFAKYHKKEK